MISDGTYTLYLKTDALAEKTRLCTQTLAYPEDAKDGRLYLAMVEETPVGAVSQYGEHEYDALAPWQVQGSEAAEIGRVVISAPHQGKGYAKQMVALFCSKLFAEGYRAIHLVAVLQNAAALATYRAIGFREVGRCTFHDHPSVCLELTK